MSAHFNDAYLRANKDRINQLKREIREHDEKVRAKKQAKKIKKKARR